MFECQVFSIKNDNFARFYLAVTFKRHSKANVTSHEESFDAIVEHNLISVVVQQLINANLVVFFCVFEEWNHVAKMLKFRQFCALEKLLTTKSLHCLNDRFHFRCWCVSVRKKPRIFLSKLQALLKKLFCAVEPKWVNFEVTCEQHFICGCEKTHENLLLRVFNSWKLFSLKLKVNFFFLRWECRNIWNILFYLSFGEGETECVSSFEIQQLFPVFPRRLSLFGVSTFCWKFWICFGQSLNWN